MYELINYVTGKRVVTKNMNVVESHIQVFNLDGDYWELEEDNTVIDFRGKEY